MFKKGRFLFLWIVIALAASFGWFFFPWPDKTYSYARGKDHYRVEEERRFRFLPLKDWGFSQTTIVSCGPTSGLKKQYHCGFFEMSDTKWVHWENWRERCRENNINGEGKSE